MPKYKMAELIIELNVRYNMTLDSCRPYEIFTDEAPHITVTVTDEDLEKEKENDPGFPEEYYEFLHVYRRICGELPKFDGMLLHSAAIAVDDKAYLFSAVSGTGKSTHITKWQELLGDRVTIVNGDKPIVRKINGEFCVCGTPWAGKENWQTPVNVPIAGICHLTRAKENSIVKIPSSEVLSLLLNQTLRPEEPEMMIKLLDLIDQLVKEVPCYRLGCNISVDAARVSYEGMRKED